MKYRTYILQKNVQIRQFQFHFVNASETKNICEVYENALGNFKDGMENATQIMSIYKWI